MILFHVAFYSKCQFIVNVKSENEAVNIRTHAHAHTYSPTHTHTHSCMHIHTDPLVCTGCSSTLDHIVAFLFKKLSSSKGPISPTQRTPFLRILDLHPEILQQMLSSIVNIIMFEECRNQWSMSRPLLGLILINEEVSWLRIHVHVFVSWGEGACVYTYRIIPQIGSPLSLL